MCILLNIPLECHGFNSWFRKRFTNFFFVGSTETCAKAQTFKAMDFDGYKIHNSCYSCQTVLIVSKNIMKLGSNRCHFLS